MIEKLGDRFIGMFKENTENGVVLRLEVNFNSNVKGLEWTIFEGDEKPIFVVKKAQNTNNDIGIYHVLGMEGTITFDDLINHSRLIIDVNMEVEEKNGLFKQKMDELSYYFQKYSVEELRELRFVIPDIRPMAAPVEKRIKTEIEVHKRRGRKPKIEVKETLVENIDVTSELLMKTMEEENNNN